MSRILLLSSPWKYLPDYSALCFIINENVIIHEEFVITDNTLAVRSSTLDLKKYEIG